MKKTKKITLTITSILTPYPKIINIVYYHTISNNVSQNVVSPYKCIETLSSEEIREA